MADKGVTGRKFFLTVQIQNFKNLGINEEDYLNHKKIADMLLSIWEESGNGRKGACSVCESKDGLYHCHLALYSQSNARPLSVAKLFGKAHTEIAYGSKDELKDYILKKGKYEEKGEIVFYSQGIENIEKQHNLKKVDLESALDIIKSGKSITQLYDEELSYVKFDKFLREAFYHVRKKSVPLIKQKENLKRVWHFGKSHSGKSYSYSKLVAEKGEENIFLITAGSKNAFDKYMSEGAPSTIFIDELRDISYNTLLNILGYFSRTTIECRYDDAYAFWNEVHITSVYSPDQLYKLIVPVQQRDIDSFEQLKNRLEKVIYHYRDKDGKYCVFEMSGSDYVSESQFMSEFNKNFKPSLKNTWKYVDEDFTIPFVVSDKK